MKDPKQMLDQFIEEHNKQELSLDDLDTVVGGAGEPDGFTINGRWVTFDEFMTLAYNMTETFGFTVAGPIICKYAKVSINEYEMVAHGSGSDSGKMGALLAAIAIRFRNGGNGY